ncbi:MAG: hypothetical protein NTX36_10950 [Proteobacteria bacterium]|nr:hypothetical protein [Pseudomonadota bacterium]
MPEIVSLARHHDRARLFYERYGFVPLPDHALQLFLPLETLRLAAAILGEFA